MDFTTRVLPGLAAAAGLAAGAGVAAGEVDVIVDELDAQAVYSTAIMRTAMERILGTLPM